MFQRFDGNSDFAQTEDKFNVGRVFIEYIPQMKEVYKIYCNNLDDATAMLEKAAGNLTFRQILQECLMKVKYAV